MIAVLRGQRWIYAAAGVLLLWAVLSVATSRFSLQSLSGVAASASFLAIAAIGQMFVVASGGGNVDLSVGSVITLAAFVTVTLTGGADKALVVALPAVLAVGAIAGALNALLVLWLRIPAIIATLANGYVLASATLLVNRLPVRFGAAPILAFLGAGRLLDVPVIILVAAILAGTAMLLLGRTAFGRMLLAVGQNARAARLSGVRVATVTASAFVVSGVLAALDGMLLSAHSGGAFLGLGTPYLLQTVGAVVVGGTLIFGGSATVFGTCCGAMLLVLIVTTLQVLGLSGGAQDVVQGAVIIAVLGAAGSGARQRR